MIILPAVIQNLKTLADKSWRIQVDTQELTTAQSAQLMALHQQFGYFAFSENPEEKINIPSEPVPEFKDDKSPSKRLRDCLYVWWEQNTSKKESFDIVWKKWCDKKCEEIKETLR